MSPAHHPFVSIIILIYNRPQLTHQTLTSLFSTLETTNISHEVILVDNQSNAETKNILTPFINQANIITLDPNQGVAGGKNIGVKAAKADWLYLSDNDMYFLPGWLEALQHTSATYSQAKIIGGFRHPYHGVIDTLRNKSTTFEQLHQAVGSTWYLSKETWNTFGPLDEGLPVGKDDVMFCNRVTAAGFKVGSIHPYKVIHCGAKNTNGEWSPGAYEWFKDENYTGQLPKGTIFK